MAPPPHPPSSSSGRGGLHHQHPTHYSPVVATAPSLPTLSLLAPHNNNPAVPPPEHRHDPWQQPSLDPQSGCGLGGTGGSGPAQVTEFAFPWHSHHQTRSAEEPSGGGSKSNHHPTHHNQHNHRQPQLHHRQVAVNMAPPLAATESGIARPQKSFFASAAAVAVAGAAPPSAATPSFAAPAPLLHLHHPRQQTRQSQQQLLQESRHQFAGASSSSPSSLSQFPAVLRPKSSERSLPPPSPDTSGGNAPDGTFSAAATASAVGGPYRFTESRDPVHVAGRGSLPPSENTPRQQFKNWPPPTQHLSTSAGAAGGSSGGGEGGNWEGDQRQSKYPQHHHHQHNRQNLYPQQSEAPSQQLMPQQQFHHHHHRSGPLPRAEPFSGAGTRLVSESYLLQQNDFITGAQQFPSFPNTASSSSLQHQHRGAVVNQPPASSLRTAPHDVPPESLHHNFSSLPLSGAATATASECIPSPPPQHHHSAATTGVSSAAAAPPPPSSFSQQHHQRLPPTSGAAGGRSSDGPAALPASALPFDLSPSPLPLGAHRQRQSPTSSSRMPIHVSGAEELPPADELGEPPSSSSELHPASLEVHHQVDKTIGHENGAVGDRGTTNGGDGKAAHRGPTSLSAAPTASQPGPPVAVAGEVKEDSDSRVPGVTASNGQYADDHTFPLPPHDNDETHLHEQQQPFALSNTTGDRHALAPPRLHQNDDHYHDQTDDHQYRASPAPGSTPPPTAAIGTSPAPPSHHTTFNRPAAVPPHHHYHPAAPAVPSGLGGGGSDDPPHDGGEGQNSSDGQRRLSARMMIEEVAASAAGDHHHRMLHRQPVGNAPPSTERGHHHPLPSDELTGDGVRGARGSGGGKNGGVTKKTEMTTSTSSTTTATKSVAKEGRPTAARVDRPGGGATADHGGGGGGSKAHEWSTAGPTRPPKEAMRDDEDEQAGGTSTASGVAGAEILEGGGGGRGGGGKVIRGALESYIIHSKLQDCLYGSVFRGRGMKSGDDVSIKILVKSEIQVREADRDLPETPLAEVFFSRELSGSPYVFSIREVFETSKCHFVVSDLAGGEDLLELLKFHTDGMPEDHVRYFMRHAALGLAFCHQHGIAMQDFSLENCLVFITAPHGVIQVRICDPGQAVRFELNDDGTEKPAPYVGCVGKKFRPPEIFFPYPYKATKVDSFCFGWCTFYLLFAISIFEATGRSPMVQPGSSGDADQNWQIFSQFKFDVLFNKLGIRDRLSDDARDFILKLMHPVPARRMSIKDALSHPFLSNPLPILRVSDLENPPPSHIAAFNSLRKRSSRAGIEFDASDIPPVAYMQKLPLIPEAYENHYRKLFCSKDKPSGIDPPSHRAARAAAAAAKLLNGLHHHDDLLPQKQSSASPAHAGCYHLENPRKVNDNQNNKNLISNAAAPQQSKFAFGGGKTTSFVPYLAPDDLTTTAGTGQPSRGPKFAGEEAEDDEDGRKQHKNDNGDIRKTDENDNTDDRTAGTVSVTEGPTGGRLAPPHGPYMMSTGIASSGGGTALMSSAVPTATVVDNFAASPLLPSGGIRGQVVNYNIDNINAAVTTTTTPSNSANRIPSGSQSQEGQPPRHQLHHRALGVHPQQIAAPPQQPRNEVVEEADEDAADDVAVPILHESRSPTSPLPSPGSALVSSPAARSLAALAAAATAGPSSRVTTTIPTTSTTRKTTRTTTKTYPTAAFTNAPPISFVANTVLVSTGTGAATGVTDNVIPAVMTSPTNRGTAKSSFLFPTTTTTTTRNNSGHDKDDDCPNGSGDKNGSYAADVPHAATCNATSAVSPLVSPSLSEVSAPVAESSYQLGGPDSDGPSLSHPVAAGRTSVAGSSNNGATGEIQPAATATLASARGDGASAEIANTGTKRTSTGGARRVPKKNISTSTSSSGGGAIGNAESGGGVGQQKSTKHTKGPQGGRGGAGRGAATSATEGNAKDTTAPAALPSTSLSPLAGLRTNSSKKKGDRGAGGKGTKQNRSALKAKMSRDVEHDGYRQRVERNDGKDAEHDDGEECGNRQEYVAAQRVALDNRRQDGDDDRDHNYNDENDAKNVAPDDVNNARRSTVAARGARSMRRQKQSHTAIPTATIRGTGRAENANDANPTWQGQQRGGHQFGASTTFQTQHPNQPLQQQEDHLRGSGGQGHNSHQRHQNHQLCYPAHHPLFHHHQTLLVTKQQMAAEGYSKRPTSPTNQHLRQFDDASVDAARAGGRYALHRHVRDQSPLVLSSFSPLADARQHQRAVQYAPAAGAISVSTGKLTLPESDFPSYHHAAAVDQSPRPLSHRMPQSYTMPATLTTTTTFATHSGGNTAAMPTTTTTSKYNINQYNNHRVLQQLHQPRHQPYQNRSDVTNNSNMTENLVSGSANIGATNEYNQSPDRGQQESSPPHHHHHHRHSGAARGRDVQGSKETVHLNASADTDDTRHYQQEAQAAVDGRLAGMSPHRSPPPALAEPPPIQRQQAVSKPHVVGDQQQSEDEKRGRQGDRIVAGGRRPESSAAPAEENRNLEIAVHHHHDHDTTATAARKIGKDKKQYFRHFENDNSTPLQQTTSPSSRPTRADNNNNQDDTDENRDDGCVVPSGIVAPSVSQQRHARQPPSSSPPPAASIDPTSRDFAPSSFAPPNLRHPPAKTTGGSSTGADHYPDAVGTGGMNVVSAGKRARARPAKPLATATTTREMNDFLGHHHRHQQQQSAQGMLAADCPPPATVNSAAAVADGVVVVQNRSAISTSNTSGIDGGLVVHQHLPAGGCSAPASPRAAATTNHVHRQSNNQFVMLVHHADHHHHPHPITRSNNPYDPIVVAPPPPQSPKTATLSPGGTGRRQHQFHGTTGKKQGKAAAVAGGGSTALTGTRKREAPVEGDNGAGEVDAEQLQQDGDDDHDKGGRGGRRGVSVGEVVTVPGGEIEVTTASEQASCGAATTLVADTSAAGGEKVSRVRAASGSGGDRHPLSSTLAPTAMMMPTGIDGDTGVRGGVGRTSRARKGGGGAKGGRNGGAGKREAAEGVMAADGVMTGISGGRRRQGGRKMATVTTAEVEGEVIGANVESRPAVTKGGAVSKARSGGSPGEDMLAATGSEGVARRFSAKVEGKGTATTATGTGNGNSLSPAGGGHGTDLATSNATSGQQDEKQTTTRTGAKSVSSGMVPEAKTAMTASERAKQLLHSAKTATTRTSANASAKPRDTKPVAHRAADHAVHPGGDGPRRSPTSGGVTTIKGATAAADSASVAKNAASGVTGSSSSGSTSSKVREVSQLKSLLTSAGESASGTFHQHHTSCSGGSMTRRVVASTTAGGGVAKVDGVEQEPPMTGEMMTIAAADNTVDNSRRRRQPHPREGSAAGTRVGGDAIVHTSTMPHLTTSTATVAAMQANISAVAGGGVEMHFTSAVPSLGGGSGVELDCHYYHEGGGGGDGRVLPISSGGRTIGGGEDGEPLAMAPIGGGRELSSASNGRHHHHHHHPHLLFMNTSPPQMANRGDGGGGGLFANGGSSGSRRESSRNATAEVSKSNNLNGGNSSSINQQTHVGPNGGAAVPLPRPSSLAALRKESSNQPTQFDDAARNISLSLSSFPTIAISNPTASSSTTTTMMHAPQLPRSLQQQQPPPFAGAVAASANHHSLRRLPRHAAGHRTAPNIPDPYYFSSSHFDTTTATSGIYTGNELHASLTGNVGPAAFPLRPRTSGEAPPPIAPDFVATSSQQQQDMSRTYNAPPPLHHHLQPPPHLLGATAGIGGSASGSGEYHQAPLLTPSGRLAAPTAATQPHIHWLYSGGGRSRTSELLGHGGEWAPSSVTTTGTYTGGTLTGGGGSKGGGNGRNVGGHHEGSDSGAAAVATRGKRKASGGGGIKKKGTAATGKGGRTSAGGGGAANGGGEVGGGGEGEKKDGRRKRTHTIGSSNTVPGFVSVGSGMNTNTNTAAAAAEGGLMMIPVIQALGDTGNKEGRLPFQIWNRNGEMQAPNTKMAGSSRIGTGGAGGATAVQSAYVLPSRFTATATVGGTHVGGGGVEEGEGGVGGDTGGGDVERWGRVLARSGGWAAAGQAAVAEYFLQQQKLVSGGMNTRGSDMPTTVEDSPQAEDLNQLRMKNSEGVRHMSSPGLAAAANLNRAIQRQQPQQGPPFEQFVTTTSAARMRPSANPSTGGLPQLQHGTAVAPAGGGSRSGGRRTQHATANGVAADSTSGATGGSTSSGQQQVMTAGAAAVQPMSFMSRHRVNNHAAAVAKSNFAHSHDNTTAPQGGASSASSAAGIAGGGRGMSVASLERIGLGSSWDRIGRSAAPSGGRAAQQRT